LVRSLECALGAAATRRAARAGGLFRIEFEANPFSAEQQEGFG
jgi:hypothetical protein